MPASVEPASFAEEPFFEPEEQFVELHDPSASGCIRVSPEESPNSLIGTCEIAHKTIDVTSTFVQCLKSGEGRHGCGMWSKHNHILSAHQSIHDVCESCGNQLLSIGGNANGYRLFLGQPAFFFRNGPGAFLEKGVIVHFGRSEESGTAPAGDSSLKVTMKYRETAFSADRYDELIDQTKVFLTMEEASSGRGKRTRRGAVEQAPCPVAVKKVITPAILPSQPTANIIEAPRPTTKRMKKSESPPQKEPAVSTSPPAKAIVSVPATTISPAKPDKEASESIKEKREAPSSTAEEKMSNRSVHDVGVHELAAMLYPSLDAVPVSEKRTVDRHIKRGLLHAVYHFVKPPTLGREDTAVGLQKLHITVAQLSELLTVCPTDRSEMWNRELMPLCASLLDVPAKAAEGRNEFSSVGDGLLHVIRTYLGERKLNAEAVVEFKLGLRRRKQKNCTENEFDPLSSDRTSREILSRLPHGLSIPLSYDHFTIALDLAFEKLKGRQAFENRKGVKGLEYVTNSNGTSGDHNSTSSSSSSTSSSSSSSSRNSDDIYNGTTIINDSPKTKKGRSKPEKINAMYGAMNPLFIEEAVVQSSRIGCSSDFLDIGSGIGQVVIQVACTVGCVSTGMEICEGRHQAALELLDAVETVLKEANIVEDANHPSLRSLVRLRLLDFCSTEGGAISKAAKVTFFNNFGPWFDPLISMYTEQCILKSAGSQVIVLNELIEVACWSHRSTFQSGRSACTWSDLDNPVFHYTILKDFNDKEWECSKCTFMNKVGLDDCLMCNAKAKAKRQGGRTSLR